MCIIFILVFVIGLVTSEAAGVELLTNSDFESLSHWSCGSITCELSNDRVSGKHSLKVSNRHNSNEGPAQTLTTVRRGGRYTAHVSVKLLNDEHRVLGQSVMFNVEFIFRDKSPNMYLPVAHRPMTRSSNGWVKLTGDFTVPDKDIDYARVRIFGPNPSVNFLVDAADVQELPPLDPHWEEETYKVIQRVRKSKIHFKVTVDNGMDHSAIKLKIEQTKHGFPFGTAVKSSMYRHGANPMYNDFINKHFNWAVLENNLKWMANEPRQGTSFYSGPVETVKLLRSKGIKVRGHCLVWSAVKFLPTWVHALRGNDLRQAVDHRIQAALNTTRGL